MAAVADLSRAFVDDVGQNTPLSVKAIASLGAWGSHSQNQERELHRWTQHLYDLKLETYDVWVDVQARFTCMYGIDDLILSHHFAIQI